MVKRNIQAWYKFAFKLFVNEQWDVIAERVENGDQTYRWVKEQLLLAFRDIEREAWEKPLAGAVFNVKQRLELLSHSIISDEEYVSAQHYLKIPRGKVISSDSSNSDRHRLLAVKVWLLETTMVNYDEPDRAGQGICGAFNKLTDIDPVVEAIYEFTDAKLAYEVKAMYDFSKEYADTMKIPLDDLIELEFEPACLPTEPPPPFTPPETWVFGDYGPEDGHTANPDVVVVDKEGNYLVLDEDLEEREINTRIQLFNPLGRFIKVIARKKGGKINQVKDMCLNKHGDLLVADTDNEGIGRIQAFDYDGNQLMKITVEKDPNNPDISGRILSIVVDDDDNIIGADMDSVCVWVFSPDGKVKSKFGQWGKQDGQFQNLQCVGVHDNKIFAFNNGVDCVRTQIFDYNGTLIQKIWPGYVWYHLAFDKEGKMFAVTDHHIEKVDLEGNREVVAGKENGYGGYLDEFFNIYSMTFLPDGRVAVPERGNNRIQVFKL